MLPLKVVHTTGRVLYIYTREYSQKYSHSDFQQVSKHCQFEMTSVVRAASIRILLECTDSKRADHEGAEIASGGACMQRLLD